jgi:hypothetical protein
VLSRRTGGLLVGLVLGIAILSCGDDQGPQPAQEPFEGIREFDWECRLLGGDSTDFEPRPISITDTTTVPPTVYPPQNYSLVSACPNPTVGSTTIHFNIPQTDSVWLFVYDRTNAPPIDTLYARRWLAGAYSIFWSNPGAQGVFRVEMNTQSGFKSHGDVEFMP